MSFLLPLHPFLITDNYQRLFRRLPSGFFRRHAVAIDSPPAASYVFSAPHRCTKKASTRAPTTQRYDTINFTWLQDASPPRSPCSSINPRTSHCYPKWEFYLCASDTTSHPIDGGHDVSCGHSSLILYSMKFLPFILINDCLT